MLHRVLPLLSIVFIATLVFAQYDNPTGYGGLEANGMPIALRGSVHDLKGNPVSGARIDVNDRNSGRVVGTAYSNLSGDFEVTGLGMVEYEVVATSGITEVRVHVESGITHDLTLTMPVNNADAKTGSNAAVSASQMKVPGKAQKLLQKAMDAFHKARLDDAFGFVQQALVLYPQYAKALVLRGVLHLQKGDAKDAQPDLEKAVELDYTDDMGFVALASIYNSQRKFDDALRTLERGMTVHPTSWQGLLETARAQCGKTKFEDALRSLGKAEKAIPREVSYQHLYRAQAFIGLKNYTPAIGELETFLSQQSTGPNAEAAKETLGRLKQAVEHSQNQQ